MQIEERMADGAIEYRARSLSSDAVANRQYPEINVVRILFSVFISRLNSFVVAQRSAHRTSRRNPAKGQRAY